MMANSWVNDYLRCKVGDVVDDPQAFWGLIMSDYQSLFGYVCRSFRFHDGTRLGSRPWAGSREQGQLVAVAIPRRRNNEYHIALNEENIMILADAYFEMGGSCRRGTRCVNVAVRNGVIQRSARAGEIIAAGVRSQDKVLQGLACGLLFMRNVACAQRYESSRAAAEEAADRRFKNGEDDNDVDEEDDYECSDLEYLGNMNDEWYDELLDSLAEMNLEGFVYTFREGYRLFVRDEPTAVRGGVSSCEFAGGGGFVSRESGFRLMF